MDDRKLGSWKEIAEYLGVSARAAQNWEKERGMPVHRLPGERGPVLAYASELESWRRQDTSQALPHKQTALDQKQTRHKRDALRSGILVVAVLAAVAILLGTYFVWFRRGEPADWRIEGDTLIAVDARGHELWEWQAELPFAPSVNHADNSHVRRVVSMEDLDGDGSVETLVVPKPADLAKVGKTVPLVCLDNKGNVKWIFEPGAVVKTQTGEHFSRAFVVHNFAVFQIGSGRRKSILAIGANIPDYPCQVSLLEASSGKLLREYWHSGHIGDLLSGLLIADLNRDGTSEIYLAGSNNSYRKRTIVAMDPDNFEGASWENAPKYNMTGFIPGRETWRVLLPNTCLHGIGLSGGASDIGGFSGLSEIPEGLMILAVDGQAKYAGTAVIDYFIRPDGVAWKTSISNGFVEAHTLAFRAGEVDHEFSMTEQDALTSQVVRLPPSYELAVANHGDLVR